jgi:hypothetical protein
MPYTGPNDPTLPDYVKKLSGKRRRMWLHVWQAAYARCQTTGGKSCDQAAFKQANGVVKVTDNMTGQ